MDDRVRVSVSHFVFSLQHANHLHVGLGLVLLQDFHPVVNRLTVLLFD